MTNFEYYGNKDNALEAYRHKNSDLKDFAEWMYNEHGDTVEEKTIVERLKDLKRFLEFEIGIGDVFGVLGHDAVGILSHSVLNDDPSCVALNGFGQQIESKLCEEDYNKVKQVKDDIKEIIKTGCEEKFVELIDMVISKIG